jgi:hypothetical protein
MDDTASPAKRRKLDGEEESDSESSQLDSQPTVQAAPVVVDTFVPPLKRLKIYQNKQRAQCKLHYKKAQNEAGQNTSRLDDVARRRERQLGELEQTFVKEEAEQRRWDARIGTGCECHAPPQPHPVLAVLLAATRMPKDVANIVCLYLDQGTPVMEASEEQLLVLRRILKGQSIFFTGRAGTGKSFVLQLLKKLPTLDVAYTAITGTAALLINGRTLNSWAGIGPRYRGRDFLLETVLKSSKLTKSWKACRALVMDEVIFTKL